MRAARLRRYNHHHDVYLTGEHSHMEKVRYDPLDLTIPLMARADPEFLDLPVEHSPSPNGLPTSLHLAGKSLSAPQTPTLSSLCRPAVPDSC